MRATVILFALMLTGGPTPTHQALAFVSMCLGRLEEYVVSLY